MSGSKNKSGCILQTSGAVTEESGKVAAVSETPALVAREAVRFAGEGSE